jgi:hypothetical protein
VAKGHSQFLSPVSFPFFFVVLWLAVTTLLGLLSGWYLLMIRYPNQEEKSLLQLKHQSGSMGFGVRLRGILKINVCPSGLRIGITRIFGIFSRDFLVPWEEIRVKRKDRFLWQAAELRFGNPAVGKLSIRAHVADRLARSASGHWPEAGPFPEETKKQVFVSVGKEWAEVTFVAALFFVVASRLASPDGAGLPISVAILFPAVAFGITSLVKYFIRTK